ncbi:Hypothetical_protein [Hexamita inflata]|uniref:Hypothetical_protein n=1 Tax=Hexamita inflata TaxID=28002 RepID=A0AA86NRK8_9EUKA|nr:Hypothetical protein HINF_LOCUS227 [Hexamita inflata]CAI9924740.1 Hypothetical protein HINF_LOCUS12385 [Hexamita inflata]
MQLQLNTKQTIIQMSQDTENIITKAFKEVTNQQDEDFNNMFLRLGKQLELINVLRTNIEQLEQDNQRMAVRISNVELDNVQKKAQQCLQQLEELQQVLDQSNQQFTLSRLMKL